MVQKLKKLFSFHSLQFLPRKSILSNVSVYHREIKNKKYKDLYANVYRSIIHNRQKNVTKQYPSTGGWISKMWYVHSPEYYSVIKIYKPLINVDKSQKMWKVKDTKVYILFDSIYMKVLQRQNWYIEEICDCLEPGIN